jgi:hypothetical protein
MRVDEEGLTSVALRFLERKEVKEVRLTLEEVKRILLDRAKDHDGCINCIYSAPSNGRFSWIARRCIHGFKQPCGRQKPIIQKNLNTT